MTSNDPERIASAPKLNQPAAAPPVVGRNAFDAALAQQVAREKEVTRHNDRVSAERRRLPMMEVENYAFEGPDGPIRLTELFGEHYLLLVQNVMFGPDWEQGCPSCTWAVDNLPANMGRVTENGIAFAMSEDGREQAPGVERVPPPLPDTSLQWRNVMYAVQWWVFAAFPLWMWTKMVRQAARRDEAVEAEEIKEHVT